MGSFAALQGAEERLADPGGCTAKRLALHDLPRLRQPLVWIDCEMTGLDPQVDTIMEIACVLTDGSLKTLIQGPSIVIHHEHAELDRMNDWCKEHHAASGLDEACLRSAVSVCEAESRIAQFVDHCFKDNGDKRPVLAGNTVHVDLQFLRRQMPRVADRLHYRIVDVSTVNELCKRWVPGKLDHLRPKAQRHRALDDILESIRELRTYREQVFGAPLKGKRTTFRLRDDGTYEALRGENADVVFELE